MSKKLKTKKGPYRAKNIKPKKPTMAEQALDTLKSGLGEGPIELPRKQHWTDLVPADMHQFVREVQEFCSRSGVFVEKVGLMAGLSEISIIDCCGIFGYQIPWADWKAMDPPAVPTRDANRRHIYLYSQLGQLGGLGQASPNPGSQSPYVIAMINLDQFFDWPSRQMDWKLAYYGIQQAFLEATQRAERPIPTGTAEAMCSIAKPASRLDLRQYEEPESLRKMVAEDVEKQILTPEPTEEEVAAKAEERNKAKAKKKKK